MRYRVSSVACRLIGLTLGVAGLVPSANGLELVRRGQVTNCAIVVRTEASACERYAAAELHDFLKRQTGVEVPLADDAAALPPRAILLGDTRHSAVVLAAAGAEPFDVATLGEEGFRLKVVGERLLVLGGRAVGRSMAFTSCWSGLAAARGIRRASRSCPNWNPLSCRMA